MKRPAKCKVHGGYSGADYLPGESCAECLKLYAYHHQPVEDEKGRRKCCQEAISTTIDQMNGLNEVERTDTKKLHAHLVGKVHEEMRAMRDRMGQQRVLIKMLCKEIGGRPDV